MSDMSDLDQLPDPLREQIHALRTRYGATDPPEAAPSVAVFLTTPTAAGGAVGPSVSPRPRSVRTIAAFGAFAGTLTGKIVLGAAIAGASIAAGQATGVVDVPGLPDRSSSPAPPAEHSDETPPAVDQTPTDNGESDDDNSSTGSTDSSPGGDQTDQQNDDQSNGQTDVDDQTDADGDVDPAGTPRDGGQQNGEEGTSGPEADTNEGTTGRDVGGPSRSSGRSSQSSEGDGERDSGADD